MSREDRHLLRALSGDLDNIVMMALRKEPARRYASVDQLAEDLRRYQKGLPIFARKDTFRYRTAKFLSRNRTLVGVVALLLVTLTLSGWFLVRDTVRSRSLEAAKLTLGFLTRIREDQLERRSSRDQVRSMLEDPSAKSIAASLADQPREQLDYADTVAELAEELYLDGLSVDWRRLALVIHETRLQSDTQDLTRARYQLGRSLRRAGHFSEAEKELRLALEAVGDRRDAFTAGLEHELALALWDQADFEAPDAHFLASLGLLEGRSEIEVLLDYAGFLEERGDVELALDKLELARAMTLDHSGLEATLLRAYVDYRIGAVLFYTRRFKESEKRVREALSQYRGSALKPDGWLAEIENTFALLTRPWTNLTTHEASVWKTSFTTRERIFGQTSVQVAESQITMARMLPRDPTSRVLAAEALRLYEARFPADHPRLVDCLLKIGYCDGVTRPVDAQAYLRRALDVCEAKLRSTHWRTLLARVYLGENLLQAEQFEAAETLLRRGFSGLTDTLGPEHPHSTVALSILIRLYEKWEKPEAAAELRSKMGLRQRSWPYGVLARDTDISMEDHVDVDFEDDYLEKVLVMTKNFLQASTARLWVYGQPFSYVWREFRGEGGFRIRVNDQNDHEIAFSVTREFPVRESFQWVSFDLPMRWFHESENRIELYKAHDPKWRETSPWEFDNLRLGVDLDNDLDRSWWFASNSGCCRKLRDWARAVEKPMRPLGQDVLRHRAEGARECRGELMMFLEAIE